MDKIYGNTTTTPMNPDAFSKVDQVFDGSSENAQSGKAVAEAVASRLPKLTTVGAPVPSVVCLKASPEVLDDGTAPDSEYGYLYIDDGIYFEKSEIEGARGMLVTRDSRGNLWTGNPVDDEDCANRYYVDISVEPIRSQLSSLKIDLTHGYYTKDYVNHMVDTLDEKIYGVSLDLENGYYTKDEVDEAVSKISGLNITVVAELPQTGETDTLYFVPAINSQEQNMYDEYIYTNGAWEKVGSASVDVDLTDYVKKTDIANASTVGVVKVKDFYGLSVSSDGAILGMVYDTDKYATRNNSALISKGTLDNVLAPLLARIEALESKG